LQICHCTVSANKTFLVKQHVESKKHQAAVERANQGTSWQPSLQEHLELHEKAPAEQSQFNAELCAALMKSDIPLFKLENEHFKKFVEKWTDYRVPDRRTLARTYMAKLYDEKLAQIRHELAACPIYVSVDETTDSMGRYVANVIVGALLPNEAGRSYVLTTSFLDQTNHATISKAVNDAMILLWPKGIRYDSVLVLLTDAAAYMKKAAVGLSVMYPKLVHVTCCAHGLHRVAEFIRDKFESVNLLVSSVKAVFVKANLRRAAFKRMLPDLPLPPEPVLSR
jgi:hypothetical protein